ncbi:hypothetical protein TcasGA2_TC011278 [Tribolium castaneum]|uniref:Uncharacterized protein n=1 Tax=Tribolium castaneum TaxID=7070 RepID=D6X3P3_TRICA|nr:hypothetical protein TcasGA2_TC011278 [Tribolium castaneum]
MVDVEEEILRVDENPSASIREIVREVGVSHWTIEINPNATCSSIKGLTGRQTSKVQTKAESNEDNDDDANGKSGELSSSCNSSHVIESSFSRKRRQKASAASKRHDEKMA